MRLGLAICVSFVALIFLYTCIHLNEAMAQALTQAKSKISNQEPKVATKSNTVVVYPIFTQAAYGKSGFYYYYGKTCDSRCLTVGIPIKPLGTYVSSGMGFLMLSSLGYDIVTDVDVDKKPDMLIQYQRVIMLHNEYVTKREFDAITSHPNVMYLYPNALYAQVKVNYTSNTITLVRGHEYPLPNISNGFGWKFDNSRMEYDTACKNRVFYKVDNGWMLNCYPEIKIVDKSFLKSIV